MLIDRIKTVKLLRELREKVADLHLKEVPKAEAAKSNGDKYLTIIIELEDWMLKRGNSVAALKELARLFDFQVQNWPRDHYVPSPEQFKTMGYKEAWVWARSDHAPSTKAILMAKELMRDWLEICKVHNGNFDAEYEYARLVFATTNAELSLERKDKKLSWVIDVLFWVCPIFIAVFIALVFILKMPGFWLVIISAVNLLAMFLDVGVIFWRGHLGKKRQQVAEALKTLRAP